MVKIFIDDMTNEKIKHVCSTCGVSKILIKGYTLSKIRQSKKDKIQYVYFTNNCNLCLSVKYDRGPYQRIYQKKYYHEKIRPKQLKEREDAKEKEKEKEEIKEQ